jgi:hypothetical protein
MAFVYVPLGIIAIVSLFIFFEPMKAPPECPPYDQCTPKGDWNAPNCKCWDSK